LLFLLGFAFHELSEDKGFAISVVPKFLKPKSLVHGEMTTALTKPPSREHPKEAVAFSSDEDEPTSPPSSLRGSGTETSP
jgi:hypothetical protein